MKFFCEYCGNRIDSNLDSKCPHCGASYKKNKAFKQLEEERKLQQQKTKENIHKTAKTITGMFGLTFIMPIIIIIAIIVIFIIGIGKFQLDIGTPKEKVTVEMNEYGETSKFKVKVTGYEIVEDRFNELDEGYELVKFNLIVENVSNKRLVKEDVNCIVDGIAQTNEFSSGYSTLPMFIESDLVVKGTATFAVPKGATSYDIRYGDNINIHIEK